MRFLRRRVGITQVEFSLAVGYSNAQISRLEQNLRPPDLTTIEARFIAALDLEREPKAVARLLDLAANVAREDAPSAGASPYKGLSYFDENDADLFVGREALTSSLVERVLALQPAGQAPGSGFMAIVGASGSGKSSLVRAGLVPALRWNKLASDWPIHVLTPTAHPVETLAASLTGPDESLSETAALIDDLMRDRRSLHLQVGRMLRAEGAAHLLLVVDQFEELFTLCRSEDERLAFISNLLAACSDPDGSATVVITLRADFYPHCAAYADLRVALAGQQEYIGAMNEAELRRAIEEPANRGRWEFEPGLIDLLLHDVGQEPGALPLLSHALLETWDRRRGRTLTFGGYVSSGGVRGAIAETAEAVFNDALTPEQQVIARRIFLRLTELGDEAGTGDTRRRATFEQLILRPAEADATHQVLKALADARLVTITEGAAEVAHEALIREWPTLRGWLEQDRESLRLHRQLSEAAHEWAAMNRDLEVLYRGGRLSQTREWAAENADEMNSLERDFLTASISAAEREAAEKEDQRQHELETARKLAAAERERADLQVLNSNRLRWRSRIIGGVGIVALVLASLAGIFAIQSRGNLRVAQANFSRAEGLRLAAEANVLVAQGGDAQTATLLSIRALESYDSLQAASALSASLSAVYNRQIFRGHSGWIYSVAISPDGKSALTGSQDGTARLWDIQSGKEERRFAGHRGGISGVAFSPDGKYVLTGGNDGTVRLWDATTGAQLRLMQGDGDAIASVAFSTDGRFLLTAAGKTAELWDATSGEPIRTFVGHEQFVSDAVFSTGGDYVLTGSFDNTARLWDATTGAMLRTFSTASPDFPSGHVTSVAYSPDGRYLLTGSDDHLARLWDAGSGKQVCALSGHTGAVNAVAFSPDGKYLLTGSEDKTASVWLAQTCTQVREYAGMDAAVKSVAFSPDGNDAMTGGEDNIGRLWAAPDSPPLRTFVAIKPGAMVRLFRSSEQAVWTTAGVTSIAVSPDGKYILAGGQDNAAHLWDLATGQEVQVFRGHTRTVTTVAFSPDGRYVLTGSDDHTMRLWEAATGQELRRMDAGIFGVLGAVFSPDGRHVLSTGESAYFGTNTATILWDASTGQKLRTYPVGPGFVYGVESSLIAFSPDGKYGLVRDFETNAKIFEVSSGKTVCTVGPHGDAVSSVAFSPDGEFVLTASVDKNARLWEAPACRQIRIFTDHSSAVTVAVFSPDGKYVLTGHSDNTAHLWDATTGADIWTFTGHTGPVNSVAFSPDGKYVFTGSQDGTVRLWDTNYLDTIRFACSLLWRDLTPPERARYNVSDTAPTCPQP